MRFREEGRNLLVTFRTALQLSLITVILSASIQADALDAPQWEEGARLSVTAVIKPYTSVKLSINEITFDVAGEPGNYASNETVDVSVGSNQASWSVHAGATDLKSEAGNIAPLPASRLAFAIIEADVTSESTYTDLGEDRLLIEGDAARPPAPMTLSFQLSTKWEDLPGTYRGDVIFTVLSIP